MLVKFGKVYEGVRSEQAVEHELTMQNMCVSSSASWPMMLDTRLLSTSGLNIARFTKLLLYAPAEGHSDGSWRVLYDNY